MYGWCGDRAPAREGAWQYHRGGRSRSCWGSGPAVGQGSPFTATAEEANAGPGVGRLGPRARGGPRLSLQRHRGRTGRAPRRWAHCGLPGHSRGQTAHSSQSEVTLRRARLPTALPTFFPKDQPVHSGFALNNWEEATLSIKPEGLLAPGRTAPSRPGVRGWGPGLHHRAPRARAELGFPCLSSSQPAHLRTKSV